ncbi:MAG: hypothetical protein K6L80_12095 [Agarilytica sp.]
MKNYFLIILLVTSFPVYSWDGNKTGKIGRIQITAAGNYGFRVSLTDLTPLCGGTADWAYVEKDDSNYETYLSGLLAAKFSKTDVTLFTNRQPNNYCKIGHIYID